MKRAAQAVALAITCAAGVIMCTQVARMQGASCFVSTISGPVQGLDRGSSCAFLGIPFAAPPTGSLRWKRPQPAAAWAPSTLNAITAPLSCAQLSAATGQPTGVEDCLMLNIWTPNPVPAAGAPVIVWIHGGGFANASANFAAQNGQNLAALTGAIIVAPNYRLGPFGFLRHDALAAEDSAAGNYGLLDQRAALVWVRDHIAAFGGNPNNVTIAGQSAGAHSVSLHLVAQGSNGLFHRAVMQSGTMSFRVRTATDARQQAVEFATALGCTGNDAAIVACLRSKAPNQVLAARPPGLSEAFTESSQTQWTPIVDGVEISDQPRYLYQRGQFSHVPVLLGANRDEGWTFVNRSFPGTMTADQYDLALEAEFGADAPAIRAQYPVNDFASPKDALARLVGDAEYVCEANRVARLIERTKTPTFLYSFEYEVDPVVPDRVVHGLEVNFVFGNNYGPPLFVPYSLGTADLALFRTMAGYWTRFADRGDPNSDDSTVTHWPAFRHPKGRGRGANKYLTFDVSIGEGKRQREPQCDAWESFFLRSITGAVPAWTP